MAVGSATDVVNVTSDLGFVPYASNAGSKTNALLVEVPQSISIVNEQEMEARGVLTVDEALRYTPGVTADQYGVEPRFDWLEIRGFAAQTFGIYRDGMRFNSLAGKLDPFELESVEVLKGPSSVLYGEVPPGGRHADGLYPGQSPADCAGAHLGSKRTYQRDPSCGLPARSHEVESVSACEWNSR